MILLNEKCNIMKSVGVFVALLLSSLMSFAQTQQGYVKTKGRLGSNGVVIAGSRLSGATIIVKGGNAVLSGNNGTFSLSIPTNSYYLQNVQKLGYVLTDPDVLSKQYAWSKNPLVLVLETPSQQTDDRIAAEKKIRRTLRQQLQEKEDEIEALKEQQKLSEEESNRKLLEIYAMQNSNEKLISEMAERYSKIDFDEVDEFNRRISSLILDGKLVKADSLLNTKGDINSRAAQLRLHLEANAQAEQELKVKQKKLEKSKALTQKELEDLAQDCYSKFEIFKIQHLNDSAEYYIKLRAQLDTTNVDMNIDAGKFYEEYVVLLDTSLNYYQRALLHSIQQYGENHLITAGIYNNIGAVFSKQDRMKLAIEYTEKAIQIKRSIVGDSSSILAKSYHNIGTILLEKGNIDGALRYLDMAEQLQRKDGSGNLHFIHNSLGMAYYRQGKFAKALEFFQKSLQERLLIFGDSHYSIATVYGNIGSVYTELAEYSKALDYQEKALDIRIKVFSNNHPSIANSYNQIGHIYEMEKKYDRALDNYQQALAVNKKVYGDLNTKVAVNYNNIGMVYSRIKEFEPSLMYLQKAYYIDSLILGENNATTAMDLNNIGGIYMKTGRLEQSLKVRLKAVKVLETCLGNKHPNVAICYNNIAGVLNQQGRCSDALNYYQKALQIFRDTYGNSHPGVRTIENNIEQVKGKMNKNV